MLRERETEKQMVMVHIKELLVERLSQAQLFILLTTRLFVPRLGQWIQYMMIGFIDLWWMGLNRIYWARD